MQDFLPGNDKLTFLGIKSNVKDVTLSRLAPQYHQYYHSNVMVLPQSHYGTNTIHDSTTRCHSTIAMSSTIVVLTQYTGAVVTLPWCCQAHEEGRETVICHVRTAHDPREKSKHPKDQGKLDGGCSAVTAIETKWGHRAHHFRPHMQLVPMVPTAGSARTAGEPTMTPLRHLLPLATLPGRHEAVLWVRIKLSTRARNTNTKTGCLLPPSSAGSPEARGDITFGTIGSSLGMHS